MEERNQNIIKLMDELKELYRSYEHVKYDSAGMITMKALIMGYENKLKEYLEIGL